MIIFLVIGLILIYVIKKFNPMEKIFGFHECCYTQREHDGYAAMGSCGGMVGGTKATEYLSEMCVDCPYFVNVK